MTTGIKPPCPNERNHTKAPRGYGTWHEWAREKGRRHYQVRCPGCGRFSIWKRRPKDEPDYGGRPEDWMV